MPPLARYRWVMVEELRVWAISIHQVRQCFAAPEELADRLYAVTESAWPCEKLRPVRGLLAKLGPLTRQAPAAPVIRPDVPNRVDAENMMASRFIASERLGACWVLLRTWLDELAADHTSLPLPRAGIDGVEFDLARSGVPTHVSIRHLWQRGLDVPLRPVGAMSVGYMDNATAGVLVERWQAAMADLEETTLAFATPFLQFMEVFGRPEHPEYDPLDLVAWWTCR